MNNFSGRFARISALALTTLLIAQSNSMASDQTDASEAAGPVAASWESQVVRRAAIGFDLAVLRPLAVATLVVGALLLAPAALFAAPGGMKPIREATDLFVAEPYAAAFERALGEF